MTREQAIDYLQIIKDDYPSYESVNEALDMAISALERQAGKWIVESVYIREGETEPFYRHDAECNKCGYRYSLISTSDKFVNILSHRKVRIRNDTRRSIEKVSTGTEGRHTVLHEHR